MQTPLDDLLTMLATAPPAPAPLDEVPAWWSRLRALGLERDPVALALHGGFVAACPGHAFAAGYQAALRALVPSLPGAALVALCATEGPSARPSDMRTTLAESDGALVLTGRKTYVTLGLDARILLVAAVRGADEGGRPRIAMVSLPLPRAGVTLMPRPPLPFVPEIAHAEVDFAAVPIAQGEVLPGDGYDDYLKPFRTVEDLHVHLALGAHLLRIARAGRWPAETIEDLLALLATGVALARASPRAPAVHLALAAHLRRFRAFVEACGPHWHLADEGDLERWQRDERLLDVAGTVRTARTAAAWRALTGGGDRRE